MGLAYVIQPAVPLPFTYLATFEIDYVVISFLRRHYMYYSYIWVNFYIHLGTVLTKVLVVNGYTVIPLTHI